MKHITDANLEHFLKEPSLFQLFYKWAVDNLCHENLSFYMDVESFKNLKTDDEIRREAHRIYHKYIKDRAENQVNLDFESKKDVGDKLANPNNDIFTQAQFTIHELIKYDLLTKFLDSDVYRSTRGLPSLIKHNIPRKGKVPVADMPKVSTESVQKLDVCLRDPIALEEFLKFTKKEFSDALPLFYLEVQKFQQNPSREYATTIFKKFLGADSEDEVDTDPKIKKQILMNIEAGNVQRDLFDKLQIQVFACMAQDNFFRFQNYMISRLAVL